MKTLFRFKRASWFGAKNTLFYNMHVTITFLEEIIPLCSPSVQMVACLGVLVSSTVPIKVFTLLDVFTFVAFISRIMGNIIGL